jgi:hypothetical protein
MVSFTPLSLIAGERAHGTNWVRSWVDPRVSLDDVDKIKILPLPGLELRPLVDQPVASRYTDYAIQAS